MKKKILIIVIVALLAGAVSLLFGGVSSDGLSMDFTKNSTGTSVNGVKSTSTQTTKTPTINKVGDAYVVYYTNNGFSPKQSQVPRGKLVKFINNSDRALLIISDDVNINGHNELNQSKSIGRGGVYTFNFTYTGLWTFHNENYKSHVGNIVVY